MKRLLLDHFRRKAWILAAGAALEFTAGWIGADGTVNIAMIQLQIGIFMGPFLLSMDLQRGLGRALATLPLCARQLGRAWWLATVAVPVAGYSGLLFAGAGLASLVNPRLQPSWGHLAISSLFLLFWMGVSFSLLANPLVGHGWRHKLLSLSGVLFLIAGGFLFFQNLLEHPALLAGALIIGLAATLAGWLNAGWILANGSGSLRPVPQPGRHVMQTPSPAHRPGGRGGLPLLVGRSFLRFFPIFLIMLVLKLLLRGHGESWSHALTVSSGVGFFPFWFVAFMSFSPLLQQWRLLRSLPVSAGRLAAGLMLAVLLPVAALGALHAGFLGLALGNAAALDIANSYLLALAVGAFSLLPIAWLGAGTLSYLLLIGLMIFAQFTPLFLRHDSPNLAPGVTGVVAAVLVAIAFLLTRHALTHTSRAYRAQANPFSQACVPNR
jgi:hypothetical protein